LRAPVDHAAASWGCVSVQQASMAVGTRTMRKAFERLDVSYVGVCTAFGGSGRKRADREASNGQNNSAHVVDQALSDVMGRGARSVAPSGGERWWE